MSANVNALHKALDTAPWGVPYALYDNLDDVVNFINSIITSTCKEHIISKNVTIHTKDKHGCVMRFGILYVKVTAVLNALKELHQLIN